MIRLFLWGVVIAGVVATIKLLHERNRQEKILQESLTKLTHDISSFGGTKYEYTYSPDPKLRIISVLNGIFITCAFLALLMIFLSYVWTDAALAAPIHSIIITHIAQAYYVLSILTILAVLSRAAAFFLSLILNTSQEIEIKELTKQLAEDFISYSETTEKAMADLEKSLAAAEKREEDSKALIHQNCNEIQQELSYTEQRITLSAGLSQAVSKQEISRKLTQIVDLLEKTKTEIRMQ